MQWDLVWLTVARGNEGMAIVVVCIGSLNSRGILIKQTINSKTRTKR